MAIIGQRQLVTPTSELPAGPRTGNRTFGLHNPIISVCGTVNQAKNDDHDKIINTNKVDSLLSDFQAIFF